ncbi:hypothetical protein MMC26_002917 [Xylographa opegraphella]|nr:hypothetical protein [Xylographa opegraphella]
MVSVSPRSTIPILLCFSHLSRGQLPSIRTQLFLISGKRFTTSQTTAQPQSKVSPPTILGQEGDHGYGTDHTRTTKVKLRKIRVGIVRKIVTKARDGSPSFIRLLEPRASSTVTPWQRRIASFEQLEYESSLNLDPRLGLRLVDDVNYRHDPRLWLELIRFRERIDGVKGIAVIWKGFSKRLSWLKDSTFLAELMPDEDVDKSWHEIWRSFLRAGYEDHQILKEICDYMLTKSRRRETGVLHLYSAVLGHILKVKPSEAFEWHERLKLSFSPDSQSQMILFNQVVESLPARQALLAIYADLPYPRLYSSSIPKLCALELYDDAISWHRMLLNRGDRPSNISVTKPLLEHLASSGQEKLLEQIMLELVQAGVPLDTPANVIQEDHLAVSRKMMSEVQAKFYNITPMRFSDEFCARLLATRMFSVKSILAGLQVLGVQAIGPLALREIAFRTVDNGTCRLDAMTEYLNQVHEANIKTGSSKFSRSVQRLVLGKHDQLLYDLVTCDQHPDVLEDRKLQESLLASYHRTGHNRQIERTMAILTVDEREQTMETAYWNILVRCDLTLRNLSGLLKKTETMRAKGIVLTRASRNYMWSTLVNSGNFRQSTKVTNAQILISIWQGCMVSGTYIPLTAWTATLRHLGMTGQLKQYESLAFWLAKWYTDHTFRESLVGAFKVVNGSQVSRRYSIQLNQAVSVHPLQVLFPKHATLAILAWGFQNPKIANLKSCMPSVRVGRLAASPALWGLRMIVRLRDLGISVNRNAIGKSCQMYLLTLFDMAKNSRKWEKQSPSGNEGRWDEYALAMEMIWGHDLFTKRSDYQEPIADTTSAHDRLSVIADEISRRIRERREKACSTTMSGQRKSASNSAVYSLWLT